MSIRIRAICLVTAVSCLLSAACISCNREAEVQEVQATDSGTDGEGGKELAVTDSVNMLLLDDVYAILFYVDEDNVLQIAEKMKTICPWAYMNGYNWEAFLNCYLKKNAPDILEVMNTDPEAMMYCVYIDAVHRELAEKYADIIRDLFANEEKIYSFLREYADDIEWDDFW